MGRTLSFGVLVRLLVAVQLVSAGQLGAQVPGTAGHEHLTEVACVDVLPGEKRPEFGCFNIGVVTAGEQCLETPAGANRARAGGTMTVPSNTPMELNVNGTALRRAFAVVIHDAAQERGIPSDWKPSGACSR
jgi:hypothetical protein